MDIDWLRVPHTFTETNELYIETALNLSEQVVKDVAKQSGIETKDFDVVFFLSTTGLSTPSIDARLFNRIPLNHHIKRIPIWGLGCAAGAGGLARAYDYLKAFPKHKALIITVELCSLSFHLNELSTTNIVSAAIFGDGASACAVFGDEVSLPDDAVGTRPGLLGSMSTIYPDTLDVMSWKATSEGFKVKLSRDIPTIVSSLVKPNIEEFLKEQNLSLSDLSHFALHPGGTKVLNAYEEGLNISSKKLSHSYETLRNFGNMSSTTVFFVLKSLMESEEPHSHDYGLLGALGPGFSSELVLMR